MCLESMPLADQIRMFYSADAVVGAHGGGLANLVFCRPGTVVVECFHKVNPCYYVLAGLAGCRYGYSVSKGASLDEQNPDEPIVCDVDEVVELYRRLSDVTF